MNLILQVHPEGKFVVDVDKNIDINDVSAAGDEGSGTATLHPETPPALHPGDAQLPGCSEE